MQSTQFQILNTANFPLHHTNRTKIISNALAPHFIDNLLKNLHDSYFCIILDEGIYVFKLV